MRILLGLAILFFLVIVLLLKEMKSMRNQFELNMLEEKKHTKTEIEAARKKAESEVAEARKKAESEVAEARENAEQRIREYKEYIESQREVLMGKDEKTLMIDTIIALGGLGERLTHMEETIEVATIKQSKFLGADADFKITSLEAIQDFADFKVTSLEAIQGFRDDIDSIKSETSDIYRIKAEIDDLKESVDSIKSETNSIYWDTRDIKSCLNS